MMDSLSLSLSRRCIESLTTELKVDLLLHWLDPDSALILALTVPRFYQVYKSLFPDPINLNRLIKAIAHDTRYWIDYYTSMEAVANYDGLNPLNPLKFNFWYPGSHYIYYGNIKITHEPETPGRSKKFGRFLSREVFAPNNSNGSTDLNEPENVALKKLKQRYLQCGLYNAVFLRLTGVPLEYPHNLGEHGWNSAVMEMLKGVVATMDNPGSLLQVKKNGQLCFPWPGRLKSLMADGLSVTLNE
ncbi:hypothetical protein EYC84_002493 [Monilinia fructicola]|uniref:Uncharacterized protein n=1 Tax=Monilinia fructicola TaxID=38448 RepID=A0A5M9JKY7_MONFR|nr:hypothetical protein EYC84_002493 [Monilinia fructicola]